MMRAFRGTAGLRSRGALAMVLLLAGCASQADSISVETDSAETKTETLALRPMTPSLTNVGRTALAGAIAPPSAEDQARAASLRAVGLDLRNQSRWDEAIATLEEAIALDPQAVSGYVILGWTHHLANQPDAAKATLLDALRRAPDHVPALNALGIVYLVEGRLDEAIATHNTAATLQPDNKIAIYNLSLAHQRLGAYDQAVIHAQRATELEPSNPHPWIALAIAHHSSGNLEAARTAYQTATQLNGRYGDRASISTLERAGFSPAQIDLAAAILAGES